MRPVRSRGAAVAIALALLAPPAALAQAAGEAAPPAADDVASFAEPTGELTLDDALTLAVLHSPQLEAFSWDERMADARRLQARKLPNPELDVRAYRLGIPRSDTRLDEARVRAIVSQEFELGGKRASRVALAEAERDLAAWDYRVARREVDATVASRFAAVLGAQRQVAALDEFVAFLEDLDARVGDLVERGVIRRLEIHSVARRLGLARIDQARARAELTTARYRLAASWGGTEPRFAEARGGLDAVREVPPLPELLEVARRSPSIVRWDVEQVVSQARLDAAKASRFPDLQLGAGIRWEDDIDDSDLLVDLEISLPIFDRKQGDIREAEHGIDRARVERRAAEAELGVSIAEAYGRVQEGLVAAAAYRDEVLPAARAALEAQRLGVESRAVDTLDDLIDARRDIARATVDESDALVAYHQSYAVLQALVGRGLTD